MNEKEPKIGEKYELIAIFKRGKETREVFRCEQVFGEHGWYRDSFCYENKKFEQQEERLRNEGFSIAEWIQKHS